VSKGSIVGQTPQGSESVRLKKSCMDGDTGATRLPGGQTSSLSDRPLPSPACKKISEFPNYSLAA
jgi:hypothetical protein